VADAAVVLAGRRILAVGPRRTILRDFAGPVDELGEAVLCPGLVNAHTHLELSHLAGAAPAAAGFCAWVRWLMAQPPAALPPDTLARAVAQAADTGAAAVIDVGNRAGPAVGGALLAAGRNISAGAADRRPDCPRPFWRQPGRAWP
jgi:cytosine/adenosine deaminase-related metal-dependent hydrolase